MGRTPARDRLISTFFAARFPSRSLNRVFTLSALTLAVALVGASQLLAQETGSVLGQPTFQKYINVGGGVDEVNVGDLTVHASIPLTNKGSYGPPVGASLNMDSRTYLYNYNEGSGNQIFAAGGFSFASSARASTQFWFSANGNTGNCSPPVSEFGRMEPTMVWELFTPLQLQPPVAAGKSPPAVMAGHSEWDWHGTGAVGSIYRK